MTKFVTTRDALVVSPLGIPPLLEALEKADSATEREEDALGPDLENWLLRQVANFEFLVGVLSRTQGTTGSLRWAGYFPDGGMRWTPVTREGLTYKTPVPDHWRLPSKWSGRVVDKIEAFANAEITRRPPPEWWRLPVPESKMRAGEWNDVITYWEHMAIRMPALDLCRVVEMQSRRWWEEIRQPHGEFDAEMDDPVVVEIYLGWPSYLRAALGGGGRCSRCSRRIPPGREYCQELVCQRARSLERQQRSRRS